MARKMVVVLYDDMWSEIYEKEKNILIEASLKFRYSPQKYVDAKHDCIMSIIKKAKSYYKNK